MTDELNDKADPIVSVSSSTSDSEPKLQEPPESELPQESLAEPESEIITPQVLRCIFDCTETKIKQCFKCKRPFCATHAAKFSPNFCQDCFKNLQVVLDKYTRVTEDFDSITEQLITRRESCNQIKIDGPDYVFYTMWINQLNDEELKSVFEFHYFIVKLIEHENEIRIVKKKYNLKRTPVPLSVSTTTTTQIKKTTKPKDMRAELRKLGIPEATIDAMLSAGMGALSTLPKP